MRKYVRLFALLLVLGAGVYLHRNWVLKKFYNEHMELAVGQVSAACKLPRYDPFDPSILKYIVKPWPKIECASAQLPLTFIDSNGRLKINSTAAAQYRGTVQCSVQQVERPNEDDDHIILGPSKVCSDIVVTTFAYIFIFSLLLERRCWSLSSV
jgi:hypothetical protein